MRSTPVLARKPSGRPGRYCHLLAGPRSRGSPGLAAEPCAAFDEGELRVIEATPYNYRRMAELLTVMPRYACRWWTRAWSPSPNDSMCDRSQPLTAQFRSGGPRPGMPAAARVAPPDHQTGRWPPGIPGSGTKRPPVTVPICPGVRPPFLLGAALSLVVEMIS